MKISREERFLRKVEKQSYCWLWKASTNPKGYGWFSYSTGVNMHAHRVAWLIFKGLIPKDCHVLHKCDIPSCVNPDHLFLGTNLDNMRDKVKKGRAAKSHGDANKCTKYSFSLILKVREYRALGMSKVAIAEVLKLRVPTVKMFLNKRYRPSC